MTGGSGSSGQRISHLFSPALFGATCQPTSRQGQSQHEAKGRERKKERKKRRQAYPYFQLLTLSRVVSIVFTTLSDQPLDRPAIDRLSLSSYKLHFVPPSPSNAQLHNPPCRHHNKRPCRNRSCLGPTQPRNTGLGPLARLFFQRPGYRCRSDVAAPGSGLDARAEKRIHSGLPVTELSLDKRESLACC